MDLDADGHIDLISGSWPGELYLFRGRADHTFADREMLIGADGHPINVGASVRKQRDGSLLITGTIESETVGDTRVVTFRGKRYESSAKNPVFTTGCAAAVHATDFDGDGDLDLLVGEIGGAVYLIPNEGSKTSWAFGTKRALRAGGKKLAVPGDAGPFVADWDGDGRRDLLVGAGDGSVSLFRNIGTDRAPKLAAAENLVPKGTPGYGGNVPTEPQRGTRAKVCATDFDGDGRLDLLLGDLATLRPPPPDLTDAERAEHDRIRAEVERLEADYRVAIDKVFGPNRETDEQALAAVNAKLKSVSEQLRSLRAKLPPDSTTHGWVWFFRRTPKRADL